MSENKINIDEFKAAINAISTPDTVVEWHGIEMTIKRFLSLEEMLTFVNDVVSSCFEEKTGEYIPEIKDFAIRCSIMESYAGFVLPSDLSEKYSMIYNSDIVSFIVKHIDKNQFESILSSIDDKIEHQAQNNIEAINKQMNELIAGFSTIEQNLSNIFGNVDSDTISKIAGAIVDGSFDEKKLVDAFKAPENNDGKIVSMPKKEQ